MSQQSLKTAPDDETLRLGPAIRRLRKQEGWSIQELASRAGVSSGTVHKIEKGTMSPTITVLLKIARALNHSVDDLLSIEPTPLEPYRMIRASDRRELKLHEFPVTLERLVGNLPDRMLEAGVYVAEEAEAGTAQFISHPGEKIYMVLEGRVRMEIEDEAMVLEKGDVLHLKGTAKHRWQNAQKTPSHLLFVMTPPPFTK